MSQHDHKLDCTAEEGVNEGVIFPRQAWVLLVRVEGLRACEGVFEEQERWEVVCGWRAASDGKFQTAGGLKGVCHIRSPLATLLWECWVLPNGTTLVGRRQQRRTLPPPAAKKHARTNGTREYMTSCTSLLHSLCT